VAVKAQMAPKFERKCGLVVVTGRGELNLYWLIAACKSPQAAVNVHRLLANVYTRIGDTPRAINEYIQAISQRTKDTSIHNRIALNGNTMQLLDCLSDVVGMCGKILQLLECLSDVNKTNLLDHYKISRRQLLPSRR
jgi:hypothetical protein